MSSTSPMAHDRAGSMTLRTTLQKVAAAVGAVFLLVGILGFIPGITSNLGDITFASDDSQAMLVGVFQVSVFHNLVHLAFGIAGLLMARTLGGARAFLVGGGIIYLVLWLYGLVTVNNTSGANFVPMNAADNWLHLVLGIGMIGLGLVLGRATDESLTPESR
jgi:hypothetical protein